VQQFPTTLFHKDLAPEGQVFMTEADVPSEAGWVDTPAAFVVGYKKPVQVVAADAIPADAPAGFVPQPYPSVRYRLGDEASARTVTTAEEDAELEAAEPGVWKHSHDPKAKVNVDAVADPTPARRTRTRWRTSPTPVPSS
jgi:hypothetical protein